MELAGLDLLEGLERIIKIIKEDFENDPVLEKTTIYAINTDIDGRNGGIINVRVHYVKEGKNPPKSGGNPKKYSLVFKDNGWIPRQI